MENTLGKYIYSPQIYAYKIKNKCSSKSTDGMWGLSTAFESRCPFPLHRIHLGALIVAETQSQSPPAPQQGRQGGGRRRKGYTLAVEYNMHVTWEGRGIEMYIQTPGVRGPSQEALS